MLKQNPRLLVARDPFGNTALVIAMNSGCHELAQLLYDAGIEPDLWEAAAIGDVSRMKTFTEKGVPIDAWSPEGLTPLMLAAHFGYRDAVNWLIDNGADINCVSKHAIGVTALHACLFAGRVDVAKLLIERGADVKPARKGSGWPRAGWTALHYAA